MQYAFKIQVIPTLTLLVLGYSLAGRQKLPLLFSTQDKLIVPHFEAVENQNQTRNFSRSFGRRKRLVAYDLRVLSPTRTHGLICGLCIMMDAQFIMQHESKQLDLKLRGMVANVSWIFRSTDWNSDGIPDNIGLSIRKVRKGWRLVSNEDRKDYYVQRDADELLRLFGRDDYTDCCIAVGFTMKPFLNFRAGVSLIASRKVMGGICENRLADPNENIKSMNLVLISGTGPNEWKLDLEQVGMVLLHELGHSFGSRHDNSAEASQGTVDDERTGRLITLRECSGYRPRLPINDTRLYARRQVLTPPNGRFIMWGQTTADTKKAFRPNNFLFSNCSKRSITQVIESGRTFCFESDSSSFCGNGILEDSEECDCGSESSCEKIKCCGSRTSSTPCKILAPTSSCTSLRIYKNLSQQVNAGTASLSSTCHVCPIRGYPMTQRTQIAILLLGLILFLTC